MLVVIFVVALICVSEQKPSDSGKTQLDRGNSSCKGAKKVIRWFYDEEMEECFEYLYEGCGGSENTFDDRKSCTSQSIPIDKLKCAGNFKISGTCTQGGETCPKGSKCDLGSTGGGICCDTKNEEEWKKERNPKCKKGKLSQRKEWFGEETRFGKSCSHKFCPSGYKCVQGKKLAYCCSE